MKNAVSIILALGLLLCSYTGSHSADKNSNASVAEPDEFPVPKNIPGLLFYIQRDPNANTIVYHLNMDERGQVSRKTPVDAFWIRYTDGGERRDLNYLQRKFAYGINSKPIGNAAFELRSVAYSKMPLILRKDSKNEYHVYANIDKKECILSRVFIRIDGGTFWSPNVLYIELKGTEIATGKTVVQRIKPV
ncbi:DUF4833 domain-containing protein [Dyadobacter sp. CY326]|uniref:DUF4833 domain-containing protein n=1 Tax=Dyadobacter sp. CY326 TaxID=2907300 RepID=UPI001F348CE3|nr:DUF4833 domain-containing protein [Dyadobacter sp. CY326]MCE7064222.1 DUF4833 domain-containing protein [Dyadobacter sp. CY326]